MRKLTRYTTYLASGPCLTIIYPHAAEVTCMSLQDLPIRLQACLVELSSYGCTFACGDGAWAVSGAVARLAREAPTNDPTPERHTWQHQDIVLAKPKKPSPRPTGASTHTLIIHFDGGFKERVGAGGFLLWGREGTCVGGKGLCYADAQARMTHTTLPRSGLPGIALLI